MIAGRVIQQVHRPAGLHDPNRVAADISLQASTADRAGDLAVLGYQHVSTNAAVGGAARADDTGQRSDTASPRGSLVDTNDVFKFVYPRHASMFIRCSPHQTTSAQPNLLFDGIG